MEKSELKLFVSDPVRIEGESIQQLERVSRLPGMVRVVGYPDLHPGKGSPVGAAMFSQGEFYPYLVGSDVGCGMGLFATELKTAKAKPEKWARKLHYLEEPWDGDSAAWLEERGISGDNFARSIGTIGGGNHFAEILKVREIKDQRIFNELGLSEDHLALLVHSGSRGLGETLLRSHTDRFRDGSLKHGSEEAAEYLHRHNIAINWGKANRELIAMRFLEQLGSDYDCRVDLVHNSVTKLDGPEQPQYLHRKGAAASNSGAVIIPGSRGAASYLVMPAEDQSRNLWSVAHGAGRKWNRSECAGRLRDKYNADSLRRTALGSYVICEDKGLLYEEAPQAYKDIEMIINEMVEQGLVSVIASFTPLLTYKVRDNRE